MLDWPKLMRLWSTRLLASELAERVEPPPPDPAWLGFEPAAEETIRALETRLGVSLPPSYRAFLAVSDGWRRVTHFIDRIRPAAEVDWFRVENEHWVEAYSTADLSDPDDSLPPDEEFYTYDSDGSSLWFRTEHMQWLLQISDVEDGVYLLNPEAVTPDGEWEAWFFANWVPGAHCYPSFAHLMLAEYRSFAKLEEQPTPTDLPTLPMPNPTTPRVRATRTHDPDITAPSLDALIGQMRTEQGPPLDRAIRIFFGRMGTSATEGQRPDLVPALVDLFRASPNARVRCACLAGIRHLAAPDMAPDLTIEALADPDPDVVLHAIWSLDRGSPDIRSLGPLCRFIESSAPPIDKETAMRTLSTMGDERAVPSLRAVLLDTANRFEQSFGSAALALAKCGEAGFAALEEAIDHPDPRVRLGVAIGMAVSHHPRAEDYLARLADDPDPKVAARARLG